MPFMGGELCVLEINLCDSAHFYWNFMNRFYQYAINHDFLENVCGKSQIFVGF